MLVAVWVYMQGTSISRQLREQDPGQSKSSLLLYVHACVCVCSVCVCMHVHMCVCVGKGGGRVMLVRHLCVLHVSFWCLELCVFLFDCLLYAPWAQLRRCTQRPHYYYDYLLLYVTALCTQLLHA